MECTIFLRNWYNIALKSISAVSLLNFINEGSGGEKGMHKMRESYDSLTHWAQIKVEGHVVVPILREKNNLCDNWPITWTECTPRLKNWCNKVFKSLNAVSLLNFINDGMNQKRGTYKRIEPYTSLTSCIIEKWKVVKCQWNPGLRRVFLWTIVILN
jgi:hypothetical protein